MTYPIILYPKLVDEYLNGKLPDLERERLPIKPEKIKFEFSGYLFGIFAIIILLTFLINESNAYVVYILLPIIIYYCFNHSFAINRGNKKSYEYKLNKYYENYRKVEIENQRKEKTILSLSNSDDRKIYAKSKISEILKKQEFPFISDEQIKKGLTESFFFKILYNQFGTNIKGFRQLVCNSKSYYPDIVFQNENLCIDIEIDEPYTLKDKKTIHCIDSESDRERDESFVKANWIVIRFAEKQILLEPYECCKVIAEQIFILTGENHYLSRLNNLSKLQKIERWTHKSASHMAENSTRNELYLKAFNQASQLEYFPKNYFENDGIYQITRYGDFKEECFLFLNNNYPGAFKIAIKKDLFDNIKIGETTQIDINRFDTVEDDLTVVIPKSNIGSSYEHYEEVKEKVLVLIALKAQTHNIRFGNMAG